MRLIEIRSACLAGPAKDLPDSLTEVRGYPAGILLWSVR